MGPINGSPVIEPLMGKIAKKFKKMSKIQQLNFSLSGSINNTINRVLSCKNFANNDFGIFLENFVFFAINGYNNKDH